LFSNHGDHNRCYAARYPAVSRASAGSRSAKGSMNGCG